MRSFSTAAAVFLLFGTATWAAAAPSLTGNQTGFDIDAAMADKNAHLSGNQHYDGNFVGGETIGSAVTIGSIPFNDTGNTCGYVNDYDEVCPYTDSQSGDVVYKYTPAANVVVNINLCTSQYDTKVYVYEQAYTPGAPYACNDDAGCGITGYQSRIAGLALTGGYTYYIVVDGYFSDCGDYTISVGEPVPCAECPPGSQLEGEPPCNNNYVDTYNGGCNSDPYVFSPVDCNTICGTTFLYADNSFRDTDWYEVTLGPGNYTYTGIGDGYTLQLLVTDTNCPAPGIPLFTTANDCETGTINFNVPGTIPPGTYYLWAGWAGGPLIPCEGGEKRYTLTFNGPGIPECAAATGACCLPDRTCLVTTADECAAAGGSYVGDNTACEPTTCQATAVEPATWGKIKNIYK